MPKKAPAHHEFRCEHCETRWLEQPIQGAGKCQKCGRAGTRVKRHPRSRFGSVWVAELWIGIITPVQFVPCPLTSTHKKRRQSVRDDHPAEQYYCDLCRKAVWDYWKCLGTDGRNYVVGPECAKVLQGREPTKKLEED
jgi:hypothetical protein